MLGLSRFARLFLLLTLLVIIPTLYLLYPSHSTPRSPADSVHEYEAGGIDSEHWRDPVKPDFEQEEVRDWDDSGGGCAVGQECEGDARRKEGVHELGVVSDVGAGVGDTSEKSGSLILEDGVLGSGVIMPKLSNATAKAELGRAAWKVLHLMTLRFPDEPTPDDRTALKSYFHLFARLYPCGECAAEFQALLKEYPPQTSSRKVASLWLCHVHNLINLRLGKEEFDCLTLDATYDCGCGEEGAVGEADQGGVTGDAAFGGSKGGQGDVASALRDDADGRRREAAGSDRSKVSRERGDSPTEVG